MQTVGETPGNYGSQYQGVPMVFQVMEDTETEYHYMVTLSFRPQDDFSGTPGQEQFLIGKEGTIAVRQALSDSRRGGFPLFPVAVGLVVVGVIAAVGAVFMLSGTGDDEPMVAAAAPTSTPVASEAPTASSGQAVPKKPTITTATQPPIPASNAR